MPAAAHTEKNGSFTNTQRMLQWHHAAVEPAGDARSDLWFTYHLGRHDPRQAGPELQRTRWTGRCSTSPGTTRWRARSPSRPPRRCSPRSTAGTATASRCRPYTELKDDGSTACGCWIYCGVYADGVNQAARRKPGSEQNWIAPEWGWAWPANRRILYNRASADPDGKPWSERKALVWWDAEQGKWTGHDVPDFVPDKAPGYRPPEDATGPGGAGRAPTRSSCRPTARRGCTRRPGWSTGRCPPTTSRRTRRCPTRCTRQQRNPARQVTAFAHPDNRFQPSNGSPGVGGVPLRGHHLPADRAPHRGRDEPLAAVPVGAAAGVLLRGVARARRRARPRAPRLGHDRHRAQRRGGPGAGHRRGCRR